MAMKRGLLAIGLLLALSAPAQAQEASGNGVAYGGRVTGTLNNATPRTVYTFEGLRGEVVAINLRATSGDLDPVLALLDAGGRTLLSQDDSAGSRDVVIDALRLPQSGQYYLVVGRFGYGLGSTAGAYELNIERIGVSSASGSALRYGDSVINAITHMQPQLFYSFRARRGDIVNIHMLRVSGNLDSYLQVVDSSAFLLADNDDAPGSGSLDAHIEGLVIERDGTYIIKATRYGEAAGTSTGRFVLTLEEADNSGLGNSPQTALTIQFGQTQENEITAAGAARYFAFDARRDDLISARMNRVSGSLDPYLVLANAGLQELVADDDSGGGQNARIEGYRIPADGRYYLVARAFAGDGASPTVGRFKLELETLGNAFDGVPEGMQRISYGTSITGRIDEQTPEALFAFFGSERDPVTVTLSRGDGDLDPVLTLLDDQLNPLVTDDDSGSGQNARIARYVLPRTGVYYLRAGRYSGSDGNPNTRGSFILVLARLAQ